MKTTINRAEEKARVAEASGFLVHPLPKDASNPEIRSHREYAAEIREALDKDPAGVITIRDIAGEGPTALMNGLRQDIAERCAAFFVITCDQGRLLPAGDRERWDWCFTNDRAAKADKNRSQCWDCCIFTPPEGVKLWIAFVTFHNPNAQIAVIEGLDADWLPQGVTK